MAPGQGNGGRHPGAEGVSVQLYEDVLPGDPFERWHQATCRNYSITQCRAVRDRDFSARVKVRPFGALALSAISSTVPPGERLEVTRRQADIRRDYRDDFLIWIGVAGATQLAQGGRTVALLPGDMCLHDQASPFTLTFSARCAAAMVIVPRPLMLARLAKAPACVGWHVPANTRLSRLAAVTVRESLAGDDAGMDAISDRVWNAALDIWVSAIQQGVPTQPSGRENLQVASRLLSAQRYLLRRLHDSELDLASASADLHMSSRTLIRLFAAQAMTPMQWVWRERLKACHDALVGGQFDRVSDAAYAYGFRNLSHFSRAFKTQYGVSALQRIRERTVCSPGDEPGR